MTVSMSTVWDRTSAFLGERAGAVAAIAVPTLLLPTAIEAALAPLKATAAWGPALALAVMTLAFFVVSLWGQLAITALVLSTAGGDVASGDPGPGGSWQRATRRLAPMILVWMVLIALGFVLLLPVLVILATSGIDLTRLGQPGVLQALPPGAAATIALYALAAVPLGLWLMARLAVLPAPVVVAEPVMLGALGRSFRLTRGLALKIIGVLLLYGIVSWVATAAAQTVVGSLLRLLLAETGTITVAGVLTAVVTAVVATIFSVIATVFTADLYLATRAREDATSA